MKKLSKKLSLLSVIALTMSGCAFSDDALFPSLTGSDSQEAAAANTNSAAIDSSIPNLGTTNFEPIEVTKGGNTGTFVGQKVVSFRNDLTHLQNEIRTHNSELQKVRTSVITNAQQYHKATGAMEAKLQVGTTPGNPQMYATLQSAQNNVQVMNTNTVALNQLSARVSSDATMASNLLDSIRSSYVISGAVDEDHRQLRILENETNQTLILINSLLSEVNGDAVRQQQYVSTASSYLVSLDGAIRQGHYGVGPAATPYYNYNYNTAAPVAPVAHTAMSAPSARPAPTPATVGAGKPLFVAKFNKKDVNYKPALQNAVDGAKSKKPNVMFDVVAVSPAGGNQLSATTARSKASQIFQEIVDMGVGADKVSISSRTNSNVSAPEVHVFVR
ncbi:MAG: hypothetical protein LBL47_00635 [Lactobacillus sp.]|nr:hypothetical protein [Lactobacillus sp.]